MLMVKVFFYYHEADWSAFCVCKMFIEGGGYQMSTPGILEALKNNGFSMLDYLVIALYIVILVGMGFMVSRKKKGEEASSEDYFLAGKQLTWWAVGASLIAANISAEQFIGIAGSAYASGIAIAAYEFMAAMALIVIAKMFLPIIIKKNISTMPQFLRDRYNNGTGLAFSIFWLFLYIFIQLTMVAWLGGLAIKQILGLPSIPGVLFGMNVDFTLLGVMVVLFVIAGVYSIYGGLASVAWTDVMQVVFLVGGGIITAFAALTIIGKDIGAGGALGALRHINDYIRSLPGDRHMNLIVIRNSLIPNIQDDPYFDIPGIAVLVGGIWLTNISYWGFNQFIIQKGLAAKSIDEAKKGLLFAAFLKILIPFIVCIPGVCAFYIINAPECEALRATLVGSIARSDDAYPFLIRNFAPNIVRGLSFAALSAAIISSLASMFNSTSTIFTMDIYKQYIRKNANDRELVNIGRITSVVALVMALLAVYPIMGGADQAFQIVQEYSGFVYPGVVVIFGLGLLWKRSSGRAAIAAAIATFAFSILFKFILPNEPFMLRMGYVFICTAAIFIVLSLTDKNTRPAEKLTEKDIRTMLMWARVCFVIAVISLLLGVYSLFNETLRNLGFEAMFFFASVMLVGMIYLRSNAKDKVEDNKWIGMDLKIFRTEKVFNIVAFLLILVITAMYVIMWK